MGASDLSIMYTAIAIVLALLIGFGVEQYNNQDRRNYDRLNDDEVNCTSMQSIIGQDNYSFLGRL